MKSQVFHICKSTEIVKIFHKYLKKFKENIIEGAISATTNLANDLQVEPEFQL
jgi:hypothetical protein